MIKLSDDAKKVCKIIEKNHCATIDQVTKIIDNPAVDVRKLVEWLSIKQYIDIIDDTFLTVKNHNEISKEDIDCLWVLIDYMSGEDGFDYDTFSCTQIYPKGSNKVRATFILDATYVINIAHISANNIMDVVFLQNRFYEINNIKKGEEKKTRIAHTFVVPNLSVAREIMQMQLEFPHEIVYISYDEHRKPILKYLEN